MPHLCSDCQKILCSVDQFFTNGPFDESFSETGQFVGEVQGWIKAAIEGTCDLCVMMYVNYDLEKAREIPHEIASEGEMIWSFRWYIGDWVKLWFKSKSAFLGNAAYLQRQTMTDSDVLQLKALGGEAGDSTWGPRAAKAIRKWLEECVSSHDECRNLSNSTLPIRLVDAGLPITVDDINSLTIDALPDVKLCSTVDLPSDTKYLTLSHCWGREVSIKLSNKLLHTYQNQIPLEDLLSPEAKVFREAIWITRCLGYRYLWIDALCINQEDQEEKSVEISRMDQIFSGAEANLSATSASSGADGMIFNRKHSLFELFPCEWKTATVDKTHDGTLQEKKDYLVVTVPKEVIDKEPVNKRAWVFQERILAPRVIHFCKNTIHRECTQEDATELHDYSQWISAQKDIGSSHIKYTPYDSREGIDDTKVENKDWCYRFRGLVQRYSRTLLTFPQDRLASLAGIAQRISAYGGLKEDEYFAGLWEPDLPRALLWQAKNIFGERKWDPEKIGYISPSWSWAGCEAPLIVCGLENLDLWESLVVVMHVWTVPMVLKAGRFGALSDGAMIVKGRLTEMQRKRIGDAFLLSIRDNDVNFAHELYFESRLTQRFADLKSDPEKRLKEINIFWDRFTKTSEREALPPLPIDGSLDLGSWDRIEPEVLYLFPIGQDITKKYLEEGEFIEMQGLVLHRDDTSGSFRRVGVFNTYAPYPLRCNEELRMRLLKVPETELTII